MRKLGINWGKSNTYGSVTKQCYVTRYGNKQNGKKLFAE